MVKKPDNINEPFVVSDRIRQLAKERGWPDPDTEVEAFLDYHEMTGWKLKNGLKIVSREAAFRRWLTNCVKFNKGHPAIVSKPPVVRPTLPPLTDAERRENQRRLNDLITGLAARKGIR